MGRFVVPQVGAGVGPERMPSGGSRRVGLRVHEQIDQLPHAKLVQKLVQKLVHRARRELNQTTMESHLWSAEHSWIAAVSAARHGFLSDRRVRIVQMKSRQDLLNRQGIAYQRQVNGKDVRYTVVLDNGYGTITTSVRNLELIHEPPVTYDRRRPGLRSIGGDELSLVLCHVLFRAEGFETVANGKLTTSAARFAALSSVNVMWLEAAMACAATKLAWLASTQTGFISIEDSEAPNNPRLKGRALMMRRLAIVAAPKPKPKPDPTLAARVSQARGVHVMTGDAVEWHFRRADETPEEARARAAAEARAQPAWAPRA